MNPIVLEELSPSYIREQRIDLTLNRATPTPQAFAPVLVDMIYARCAPEGVVLPMLLEVQGPSPASYQRRVFTHAPPNSLVFTPREGGRHLVTLREVAHNRWFGSLRLDVGGELLESLKLV